MRSVVAVALFALLAGCTSTVSGSPAGSTGTTTGQTIVRPPTGRATTLPVPPTDATTVPAPPTSIDPAADQQYCDGTITGALGRQMQVVVVNTPNGRVDCDQAGAVLVDYYAERPNPEPGSAPIVVAGFACNQVAAPDIPQVICGDGASLLYSMWQQGG
jgi:type IV pilus biogenesis protein CpaD/CtpE